MTLSIALALAGVASIVAVNLLARRSGQPASVLLVILGAVYAVLPGANLRLQPHLLMDLVIPPLIYSAALNSSAIELRRSIRQVASLSVGLVVATTLAVGATLSLATSVPLAAAVALGAAVAPSDPVASLAVGRKAGLPARLVTVVEGEGLLNDATALTTFQVAVAVTVGGHFSILGSVGRFVLAAAGGLGAGLIVAAPLGQLRRRLSDPMSENAISLATPFAAYLLAESFGGSGVLAVAVAGIWFAHRGPSVQSSQSRLQTRAVWRLVDYLLEGFVFLLIGQQLPSVLNRLGGYSTTTVVAATAATVVVILLVRVAWLVLTGRVPAIVEARIGVDSAGHRHLQPKEVVALSWSGTRGVITLAAAFAIPLTTSHGTPFPGRDLLLFCAYITVLVTLIGQGLTFGPLLRRLRLEEGTGDDAVLRNRARVAAAQAALEQLDELLDDEEEQLPEHLADALRQEARRRLDRYQQRLDRLSEYEDHALAPDDPYYTGVRLRRAMIEAQRDEFLHWRDTGRLADASVQRLLHELDHEEAVIAPHD